MTTGIVAPSTLVISTYDRRQLNITGAVVVKQTSMISTVSRMLRMTETSLGWHQVGCSKCVMDQRWRTIWHQMKSAYVELPTVS